MTILKTSKNAMACDNRGMSGHPSHRVYDQNRGADFSPKAKRRSPSAILNPYCELSGRKSEFTVSHDERAEENIQSVLQKFDEPDGFDVVFECTGAEPCIQMSIHAAISGGKVMLIGMGAQNVMLLRSSAAVREVDIQGSPLREHVPRGERVAQVQRSKYATAKIPPIERLSYT
ncbi:hypothetical protein DFH07DRAFT_990359 [Mycena maculata]|uniref:Alcohol dehydrogenase-like C-terminal domain-containing protein n=1 Tax=Mycena maculata TaxID=230809 RepID=A0AAD7MJK1_9AGAR|nr:hypothetical protein DFH07DRAFT_972830 [Mycena maculata]KAJ7773746.1 hypothetical protein DFH07DRAFT_990359 [Mycena maculata]